MNTFIIILYKLIQVLKIKLESKTNEIAIFGAASESFTKKNINSTIDQSLKMFDQVVNEAKKVNIPIRGYVSCVGNKS